MAAYSTGVTYKPDRNSDEIFIKLETAITLHEQAFFIFITLIFAGFVALSTYKTQLNMELGVWLFYQYLKILLAAFVVLFVMAQASRLFSVELRNEDVTGRNRFFLKVSIPYAEMVGVSMGKLLIVNCMVIRTNSLKRIYAPFDLGGFQDLSDKIDAKLKHQKLGHPPSR